MTTAEKYRQFEKSPIISIAKYIFNDIKKNSTITSLEKVIVDIKTGKTPSKQQKKFYEDDFFDWFKPDEIGSEKYLFTAKDKISKYAFETKQATIFEPDTILINAIGDIGRVSILKNKASSNQQITGIRLNDNINVDYAYYYFVSHRQYFYSDFSKTTLPLINQKKINLIPFHYPNIELQESIVRGLEELEKIKSKDDLYLIDELGWDEKYKEACKMFFSIQFVAKSIVHELTNQLLLVKQLRQSFLSEAMQGKLVASSPLERAGGEATGQQLLVRIKAEKAQLIKDKKLRKEKELSAIKPEEIPFDIPGNWVWCRLGEVCYTSGRIGWKGLSAKEYVKEGPLFLSVHSLNHGDYVDYTQAYHITQDRYDESPEIMLENDDILICKDGAGIGKLGIINNLNTQATINSSLLLIRKNHSLNTKFVYYFFLSPHFQKIVNDRIMGATTPHLYQRDIVNFLFALPPITVQNQIVAKLDELMKTCDDLENSIKQSQIQNEQLLQQVLKEALEVREKTI